MLLGAAARAEAPSADVPVEDYIRLHVVAADDGDEAQALKLEVRDACLMSARALLQDCADADAAWEIVKDNLNLIELAALLRARTRGWEGSVSVEAGAFDFPDRRYGDTLVPAGRYRAVRVVIGEGAGQNWWCVLYPSLCLTEDCEPSAPVSFHSTLLSWLLGVLGGGA